MVITSASHLQEPEFDLWGKPLWVFSCYFSFLIISLFCDTVSTDGDSVNTIKESSETLLEASRDIGLEINAEKTKCMIMSRHTNSGQNQNIRIANELFEK
jgi:hypothetical protein